MDTGDTCCGPPPWGTIQYRLPGINTGRGPTVACPRVFEPPSSWTSSASLSVSVILVLPPFALVIDSSACSRSHWIVSPSDFKPRSSVSWKIRAAHEADPRILLPLYVLLRGHAVALKKKNMSFPSSEEESTISFFVDSPESCPYPAPLCFEKYIIWSLQKNILYIYMINISLMFDTEL